MYIHIHRYSLLCGLGLSDFFLFISTLKFAHTQNSYNDDHRHNNNNDIIILLYHFILWMVFCTEQTNDRGRCWKEKKRKSRSHQGESMPKIHQQTTSIKFYIFIIIIGLKRMCLLCDFAHLHTLWLIILSTRREWGKFVLLTNHVRF